MRVCQLQREDRGNGVVVTGKMGTVCFATAAKPANEQLHFCHSVITAVQIVREKLVSMEIPFVQHTTVRGSPKRQLLFDKYGKFAVPYLEVCPSPHASTTPVSMQSHYTF